MHYHDPPPPPPEPPPEKPPPEKPPPPELDGFEDMASLADDIVEFKNVWKTTILNIVLLSYQSGDCIEIDSNFSIHLSETPST